MQHQWFNIQLHTERAQLSFLQFNYADPIIEMMHNQMMHGFLMDASSFPLNLFVKFFAP